MTICNEWFASTYGWWKKSCTTWAIYIYIYTYNLVNNGEIIPSLYQLVSRISSINIYDPYQQRQLGIRVWIPKDAHSRDTSEEPLATPGRPNAVTRQTWGMAKHIRNGRVFVYIVGSIPAPSKGCHMVPKGCQFTIPPCLIGIPLKVLVWRRFFFKMIVFQKNSFEAYSILCGSHEVVSLCHPFHRRNAPFFGASICLHHSHHGMNSARWTSYWWLGNL